jgi:hypothetical protein
VSVRLLTTCSVATILLSVACSREFNASLRDGRQHLRTGSTHEPDTVVLTQREVDACMARPSCRAKLRNERIRIVD